MEELEEVFGGCKVCGNRMLTYLYPLVKRTCEACKLEQRQTHHRKKAARRKAERHAAKANMPMPHCWHCGKVIEDAVRLDERRYCGNRCRQADFRERNG